MYYKKLKIFTTTKKLIIINIIDTKYKNKIYKIYLNNQISLIIMNVINSILNQTRAKL